MRAASNYPSFSVFLLPIESGSVEILRQPGSSAGFRPDAARTGSCASCRSGFQGLPRLLRERAGSDVLRSRRSDECNRDFGHCDCDFCCHRLLLADIPAWVPEEHYPERPFCDCEDWESADATISHRTTVFGAAAI